jgi:excisionase family DNA binding protein|tara:strand:+ start:1563 stop:1793 length:231 start_codon:yes stop_codon:yes gene_type:complete
MLSEVKKEDEGHVLSQGVFENQIYNPEQVATLLGVTRPTVYQWIKHSGLIAPTVNGKKTGKRFVTGKNLIRFLEGR